MTPPRREGFDPNEIDPTDLPEIEVGNRRLRDVVLDASDAIKQANRVPSVFRRDTALVRLRDEDGEPRFEAMTQAAVRGHLDRIANWVRVDAKGNVKPVPPPHDVVADLLALPYLPAPAVDRLVTAPVFGADGTLQTEPGYHPSTRTYYAPVAGFGMPRMPEHPDAADIARAVHLIVGELLGEFPFASDAERAHAVSLLLLPFVRELVPGLTPLHLIEAPSPGTGKGLLTTACLIPAVGDAVAVMAEGRDEDEWRKRLTSKLLTGPAVIVIDNVRNRVESSSLAAVLTTGTWEDRLLGQSRMLSIRIGCAWVATANNPTMSSEIARRTVRIRLDATVDRPWLRTGFRHPNLRTWALENRTELVAAVVTIVRAWLDAGRPKGDATLGMFEGWAHTMGGILEVAGIPGFLDNLTEFYDVADAERLALASFIEHWWETFAGDIVGVADLFPLAETGDVDLGGERSTERSRRTRLGNLLAQNRDRRFGHLCIAGAGTKQGAAQWRLISREPGEHGEPFPPLSGRTTGNRDPYTAELLDQPGAPEVHEVHTVHEPVYRERA